MVSSAAVNIAIFFNMGCKMHGGRYLFGWPFISKGLRRAYFITRDAGKTGVLAADSRRD